MSLRIKLAIMSGILTLLTISLGIFIFFIESGTTTATEQQLIVNQVVSSILDLDARTDIVIDDYSPSAVIQWQQTLQAVNESISEEKFVAADEKAGSKIIKDDLTTVNQAMTDVNNVRIGSPSASVKEALVTKLELQIQKSLADSLKLQKQVGDSLLEKQNSARNSILVLLIALVLAIIAACVYLYLSISLPIISLKNVIEDISRGKLDTHIDNKVLSKKDEIGALAQAFDRTIISLKLAMRDNTTDKPQASEDNKKTEN